MSNTMSEATHPQVLIFDTTLRDGEQSPGCSMTTEEKLTMAHALEELGVDILEAGFAIASEGDFAAISSVARAVRGPRVASLAPAVKTLTPPPARSNTPTAPAFTSSSRQATCISNTSCASAANRLSSRPAKPSATRARWPTTSSFPPKTPPAPIAIFW